LQTRTFHRPRNLVAASIVLLVVVYSSSLKPVTDHNPVLHILSAPGVFVDVSWHKLTGFLGGIWQNYIYLRGVKEQNQLLGKEVVQLKGQLIDHHLQSQEIKRLKSLLGFSQSSSSMLVAAKILSRGRSGGFEYVRLSKGKNHGLTAGMAVLSQNGIVGHLMRVGSSYSDIQLITHVGSSIDVILERTRLRGVITGTGGLTLRWYPRERLDIKIGDTLISSGLVGAFPQDFPVATVSKVIYGIDHAAQEVWLLPTEDVNTLEYVFVLKENSPLVEALSKDKGRVQSF